MNYFTATIPLPLAEKLKEKGMPMEESRYGIFPHFVAKDGVMYFPPTFASTFDWFMSKECEICIKIAMYSPTKFDWAVTSHSHWGNFSSVTYPTWHEAAEKAIEKALTLI